MPIEIETTNGVTRGNWRVEMWKVFQPVSSFVRPLVVRSFLLTIPSALLSLWIGLGMQAASALAAEVKPAGETDWPKTVASAKNEGKVAVFLYQRENIEAAVKGYRAHAKSSESGARRR